MRLRYEPSIDVEAVVAGEEGGGGFVVADFGLEGWGVGEGDVGWVGEDDVEWVVGFKRGEEIAFEEDDLGVVGLGVFAGYGEGGGGDVGGVDLGCGEVGGEGYGDGPGSGSDVGDAEGFGSVELGGVEKDGFDELFGFGAGD